MPKLTEQRFHSLPHAAVQLPLVRHISPRDQQHLTLLGQQFSQLRPIVAQIRKHYSPINRFGQLRSWPTIIKIARRQYRIHNAAIDVAQRVQFKAEEPTGTTFTEISAFITKQTHSSVTNGFTDRNRLGIHQVESASAEKTSRDKQPTDEWAKAMQASNPLLVRTKLREGRGKVGSNKLISLLEGSHAEVALHQGDGDDFRIGEGGLMIGRTSPVCQAGMRLKEVINKAEDVSHLVYNGGQMGRPPSDRLSLRLHSIHSRNYGDPLFQLNTQVELSLFLLLLCVRRETVHVSSGFAEEYLS